jgi:general secretion pathway protein C
MVHPVRLPAWLNVGKVAALANATLAVLIGIATAQLTLDLLPTPEQDAPPPINSASGTPRNNATSQASQIAAQHLFGIAGAQPIARAQPQEAPETRLNLTLHGVLAFEPQSLAMAIISAGSAEEKVYSVGERIAGQATLAEVYGDRVIIERAGVRETLRLPENLAALNSAPASSARDAAVEPTRHASAADLPAGLPSQPGELRDHLIKNPAELAKLVAAQPHRENGRLVGYKLSPKQGGQEFLSNFGVLPDDVITKVNGVALTSQKRGIRALRKLIKADTVELTVLRNGTEVPVNIPLN